MITNFELMGTVILTIAFIPLIAYLDYYLFKKHLVCEKCGFNAGDKHAFLLATTLEVFMFIAGILLGMMVK